MCLSSVYKDKKAPENLVLEEASLVSSSESGVAVMTLFGQKKILEGYVIVEANLLEHHVIVSKTGG